MVNGRFFLRLQRGLGVEVWGDRLRNKKFWEHWSYALNEELKCQILWARPANIGQLGLIIDPQMN